MGPRDGLLSKEFTLAKDISDFVLNSWKKCLNPYNSLPDKSVSICLAGPWNTLDIPQ